jgi:hypothetical protein
MFLRRGAILGLILLGAGIMANQAFAGDRYIYGDVNGTTTVQTPRPTIWTNMTTGTPANVGGDTVYLGRMSFSCPYSMYTIKWNGFGWWFPRTAPQDFTGASYLKFAYKLPNPNHTLRINLLCQDRSGNPDSIRTKDSLGTPLTTPDTVWPGAYPHVYVQGGVGTAGKDGWVLDSVAIDTWGPTLKIKWLTQIDFNQVYTDSTSPNLDTTGITAGIIELDEVCFTNVASVGVKNQLVDNGKQGDVQFGLTFMPALTGIATAQFFSLDGRLLSTVNLNVTANKACTISKSIMSAHVAGADLVRITGAGVNYAYKIME